MGLAKVDFSQNHKFYPYYLIGTAEATMCQNTQLFSYYTMKVVGEKHMWMLMGYPRTFFPNVRGLSSWQIRDLQGEAISIPLLAIFIYAAALITPELWQK